MHTRQSLLDDLKELGIDRRGTLLLHSSVKSVGEVEGGADTILDVFMQYMEDGLLVMPTHTWAYIDAENPRFYVEDSPSCVGILPELFRKRPGVLRSLHPTHSAAAFGKDAGHFVDGDELFDTPCARGSVWGKLLDRKAQIMLLGVDLRSNTFMHGVEEWVGVPGRISDTHEQLYTVLPDDTEISVPSRRHCMSSSDNYWKVEDIFLENKVMYMGKFGDATVRICDTVGMTNLLFNMLSIDPDLFSDNEPLDKEFCSQFICE